MCGYIIPGDDSLWCRIMPGADDSHYGVLIEGIYL